MYQNIEVSQHFGHLHLALVCSYVNLDIKEDFKETDPTYILLKN